MDAGRRGEHFPAGSWSVLAAGLVAVIVAASHMGGVVEDSSRVRANTAWSSRLEGGWVAWSVHEAELADARALRDAVVMEGRTGLAVSDGRVTDGRVRDRLADALADAETAVTVDELRSASSRVVDAFTAVGTDVKASGLSRPRVTR